MTTVELTGQASRAASMPTSSTSLRELTDAQKRALPCFQNPGPWQDSTSLPVLKWAARQCQTRCSFQDWCNSQRLSTLAEFNTATGVWAGQIYTHRGVLTSGSSPNRVILSDQDHAL